MRATYPSGKPSDVYNWYGMTVAWTMVETLRRAGRALRGEPAPARGTVSLNTTANPIPAARDPAEDPRTRYFPLDSVYLYRYDNRQWVKASSLLDARG